MKNYQIIDTNEFEQPIGSVLSNSEPTLFQSSDLIGRTVKLLDISKGEHLSKQNLEKIWNTVLSEPNQSCWTYLPYTEFKSFEELEKKLKSSFNFSDSVHYLIEVDEDIVGWIALINIRNQVRSIEIGNVYFSHRMKQTTSSTEAVYLLMKESIQQQFRRIEWKCDDLNQPSKNAAMRFGFQFEGIFRQDRIAKGRNRNTAWFSILDEEWSSLDSAFQAWLAADNFDENGQQKIKLEDFKRLY